MRSSKLKPKLKFTASARRQFLSALIYIRRDKPLAAAKFRKRVERNLRRLIDFPNLGRIVPEFPDLPYRELIVSPYRFFYRVVDQTIWIVAVWHGAQQPIPPR